METYSFQSDDGKWYPIAPGNPFTVNKMVEDSGDYIKTISEKQKGIKFTHKHCADREIITLIAEREDGRRFARQYSYAHLRSGVGEELVKAGFVAEAREAFKLYDQKEKDKEPIIATPPIIPRIKKRKPLVVI